MPYVYLISSVILAASEGIIGGFYNRKHANRKEIAALYSLCLMCSVFVFWAIMFCTDLKIDWSVAIYSLLFAFFYTLCSVCMIRALKCGPVLLTSVLMQLSLIGTTIWGFFFWDSPFTILVGIGLCLVCIAIWLCLYTGEKDEKEAKIKVKWLIYVSLAFIGNAGCSITQRTQQIRYNGEYGNFLMLIATGLSVLVCLYIYLRSDKKETIEVLKESWYMPIGAGVCNGVLNLFVILLAATTLSPSLIYPVIGVGSLMVTTIFSAFIFKEKLKWWQWLGVLVGAIATMILSI